MLSFQYNGTKTVYQVCLKRIDAHHIKILGKIPVRTKGFVLSRIKRKDNWDYSKYITVWKVETDGVIFSNDGSVYVEPPAPEAIPEPTVEEIAEREKRFRIDSLNTQINFLESELQKKDYIFTKSEEYALVGKPLSDYDYETLSNERDVLRSKIDALRLELDAVVNEGVSSY